MEPLQQKFRSLKYGPVEINKHETLGFGSYGKVYKAKCGQLPCAAKLLHDTLFDCHDPGVDHLARKFQQECEFLSSIKHPNVVQYLDTIRVGGRSVLLMELMDESLTKCLERSATPLQYHTQVDICHDIALALAYLHSKDIVHRDLSSNNVLLIAGRRAKVTDFGMSKLIDAYPQAAPLTQVPGTLVYMPPEAFTIPPKYTSKLDCFSYGVLIIQIATGQFPNPGEATKFVEDPKYPTGRVMMVVPEKDRRINDISRIEPDHPLLPTGLDCIRDREIERPPASELCEQVAAVKKQQVYLQSATLAKNAGASVEQQLQVAMKGLRISLADSRERERQLATDYRTVEEELNVRLVTAEQHEQTVRELRHKLEELHRCNVMLQRKDQEITSMLSARTQEVSQLNNLLSARKLEVSQLNDKLSAREQNVLQLKIAVRELRESLGMYQRDRQALVDRTGHVETLKRRLSEHEAIISDMLLQNKASPTAQPERVMAPPQPFIPRIPHLDFPVVVPPPSRSLRVMAPPPIQQPFNPHLIPHPHVVAPPPPAYVPEYKQGQPAPEDMTRYSGQVTVHGRTAYFTQKRMVYAYDESRDMWAELPRCEQEYFGVAIINNKLTALGGLDCKNTHTNAILSFTTALKWEQLLHPLPTARACPAVTTTPTHLVVACGMYIADDPNKTHTGYETVDLMNLDTLTWSVACSLPVKIRYPQLKYITGQLVLSDTESNKIFKCSLDRLIQFRQVQEDDPVWIPGENSPTKQGASLVVAGRTLLAVGGRDYNEQPTEAIYSYVLAENRWVLANKEIRHPTSWALSVMCREEVIMVVGGFGQQWKPCNVTQMIKFP